jgi:hypothetical protein
LKFRAHVQTNLQPSKGLKICLNGERRRRSRQMEGKELRGGHKKTPSRFAFERALRPTPFLLYGAGEPQVKVGTYSPETCTESPARSR